MLRVTSGSSFILVSSLKFESSHAATGRSYNALLSISQLYLACHISDSSHERGWRKQYFGRWTAFEEKTWYSDITYIANIVGACRYDVFDEHPRIGLLCFPTSLRVLRQMKMTSTLSGFSTLNVRVQKVKDSQKLCRHAENLNMENNGHKNFETQYAVAVHAR